MALRFSLATLLRLREIAEQREERLLGQILQQIVRSQQTLADLGVQRRDLSDHHQAALHNPVSALAIVSFYDQIRLIQDLEKTGREQLSHLVKLRDQQLKVYEAAHRGKKVLSTMQAEQREDYQREQIRQEQKRLDDVFATRRDFR